MAWTTLTETDSQHDAGKPITKDLFVDPVIQNLNDLNDRVGASGNLGLLNGSFEEGTVGASNTPSNWSWTASGSGGTYALTSTAGEQAHGQNGFKITHPSGVGNGGGYIQTDDFIPVGTSDFLYVAWKMKVSAANGAQNKVTVLWYTSAQVAAGTTSTNLYDDTAGPTAWTQCFGGTQVPSDAEFFKLRLLGGDTATDPGSSTDIFFDDVRIVNGPEEVFQNSTTYTKEGTFKWESPSSVANVWVEAIGGGAGGSATPNRGGGGGGEYAAANFATAASTMYSLTVGAAGASDSSGTNSVFNTNTVIATAGGTTAGTTGGAGGTGGTGDIKIDGYKGNDNGDDAHGGRGARGGAGGAGTAGGTAAATSPGGGGGGDQANTAGADGMVRIWFN